MSGPSRGARAVRSPEGPGATSCFFDHELGKRSNHYAVNATASAAPEGRSRPRHRCDFRPAPRPSSDRRMAGNRNLVHRELSARPAPHRGLAFALVVALVALRWWAAH